MKDLKRTIGPNSLLSYIGISQGGFPVPPTLTNFILSLAVFGAFLISPDSWKHVNVRISAFIFFLKKWKSHGGREKLENVNLKGSNIRR